MRESAGAGQGESRAAFNRSIVQSVIHQRESDAHSRSSARPGRTGSGTRRGGEGGEKAAASCSVRRPEN